jgi:hypothetical protein
MDRYLMAHYSDRNLPAACILQMLDEYQDTARHHNLDAYIVSKLLPVSEAAQRSENKNGVYILYRDNETLVYIGLSLKNIAARLRAHNSRREKNSSFWSIGPATLAQTVFVPNSWEAPSLEEFLVQKAQEFVSDEESTTVGCEIVRPRSAERNRRVK